MIMRWATRGILGLGLIFSAILVSVIALQDATSFTSSQVHGRSAALFVYGSTDVPHDMAGQDHPHQPLFALVESGAELSTDDSQTYRIAFQAVLAANQRLFRALDNNLVFATDHAMDAVNSVSGSGIVGKHDLHAESALSNFVELSESLEQLSTVGSIRRIMLANRAYKSLTDLMVHLAPAVHSIVVDEVIELPQQDEALVASFDAFRMAFHRAGFAPINSPMYLQEIEMGVAAYASLVSQVQAIIVSRLSPLEHQISGRWLAIQSVSPQLSLP